MRLTPVEEYGLRCLIQLAKRGDAHPVTIRTIAESEGLSTAYVGKLMFLLSKGGLVQASRGVQGGYALSRPPEQLTLAEFFRCMDPTNVEAICGKFTGSEDLCVHNTACAIKQVWSGLESHIDDYLNRYTLRDLAGPPAAVAPAATR